MFQPDSYVLIYQRNKSLSRVYFWAGIIAQFMIFLAYGLSRAANTVNNLSKNYHSCFELFINSNIGTYIFSFNMLNFQTKGGAITPRCGIWLYIVIFFSFFFFFAFHFILCLQDPSVDDPQFKVSHNSRHMSYQFN